MNKTKLLFLLLTATLQGTLMAKKELATIIADLEQAHRNVEVGASYYHYRNPEKQYVVVSLSVNTANEDQILVNYQTSYDGVDVVWSRPLEDFLAMVEHASCMVPKFTRATFIPAN